MAHTETDTDMDNFELTKIAGAVLAALLLIFGAKTVIEMRSESRPVVVGYALPGAEPAAAPESADKAAAESKDTAADGKTAEAAAPADGKADAASAPAADAPAAEGVADVVALLAKASADNGKGAFSKCKSCHVVEKGKASTVGPNLWGVVNRPKGSYEGFKYSEAMKAKGGEWTFENLSAFLRNPKGYVAGTKMVFAGIKDPAEEADVMAYLATLADTPVPLPK